MQLQNDPPLHLTYCLNIHPGETWPENLAAIRHKALAVRDLVTTPGKPFGIGLRLSHRAAVGLAQQSRIAEFKEFLKAQSLYVYTVNGFPYGRFHGAPIKENVYRPDWRTSERRDYTILLADTLSELLPNGTEGSISTVPCSYKKWVTSEEDVAQIVRMLVDCVAHFAAIRNRFGKTIHMGLEPEPDCFIESTDDVIRFFHGPLRELGEPYLAEKIGCSQDEAERLIHRHLGICFDTCHISVLFEEPATSLQQLTDSGILISKIQITAAIKIRPTERALETLRLLHDPVYLHQVKVRGMDGTVIPYPDLHSALRHASQPKSVSEEWRIHFHVPVYSTSWDCLGSTSSLLTPKFWEMLSRGVTSHLEIETYTHSLLPDAIMPIDLTESISKEYSWVLKRLSR